MKKPAQIADAQAQRVEQIAAVQGAAESTRRLTQ